MKRRAIFSFILLLICFMFCSNIVSAKNGFLSYQGKVSDLDYNIINEPLEFTFYIYEGNEGEKLLWQESQITKLIGDSKDEVMGYTGFYNIYLGTKTPFPDDLFKNKNLYLEVEIINPITGKNEILSPLQHLVATPAPMELLTYDFYKINKTVSQYSYDDNDMVVEIPQLPNYVIPSNIRRFDLDSVDSEKNSEDENSILISKDDGPDGTGPTISDNYIRMYIENSYYAGSTASSIEIRFDRTHNIRLPGPFDVASVITWDLNPCDDYLRRVNQDCWDQISLGTYSGDGIKIDRLVVVHSGEEILNWYCDTWLDRPNYTTLGLAAKILERKLEYVDNTSHAAIHYGAREIGKTDGDKYGTSGEWCSEFASWCQVKNGFMTPPGSIGTRQMKNWFDTRDWLFTRSDVLARTYIPSEGDYLSLWGGDHSATFIKWIDSTTTLTEGTRFYTIEGNSGSTVARRIRCIGDIDRVGKAQ